MSTASASEPAASAELLPPAAAGDRIDAVDLQTSIDALRTMAKGLDDLITDELGIAEVQRIGRAQAELRSCAAALVGRQIDLLPGEAKVAAEHVNGALRYADEAIARVSDWKLRLARIAAVIGFVGAVNSGSGVAIVKAAATMKSVLS